jgi:hypothetical protein
VLVRNASDSKAGYLAIQACLSDSTVLVRLVLIFPADLKTLWKLQNDLEARYGRQGVIMGLGLEQQGVLSSGANFGDVFHRLSWLRHLQISSEAGHLTFPWMHDGET